MGVLVAGEGLPSPPQMSSTLVKRIRDAAAVLTGSKVAVHPQEAAELTSLRAELSATRSWIAKLIAKIASVAAKIPPP